MSTSDDRRRWAAEKSRQAKEFLAQARRHAGMPPAGSAQPRTQQQRQDMLDAHARAKELQPFSPIRLVNGEQTQRCIAIGILVDPAGNRTTLVAISGYDWRIPAALMGKLAQDEVWVEYSEPRSLDAEQRLMAYCESLGEGYQLSAVGAGFRRCETCVAEMDAAGIPSATPAQPPGGRAARPRALMSTGLVSEPSPPGETSSGQASSSQQAPPRSPGGKGRSLPPAYQSPRRPKPPKR